MTVAVLEIDPTDYPINFAQNKGISAELLKALIKLDAKRMELKNKQAKAALYLVLINLRDDPTNYQVLRDFEVACRQAFGKKDGRLLSAGLLLVLFSSLLALLMTPIALKLFSLNLSLQFIASYLVAHQPLSATVLSISTGLSTLGLTTGAGFYRPSFLKEGRAVLWQAKALQDKALTNLGESVETETSEDSLSDSAEYYSDSNDEASEQTKAF